MTTSAVTNPYAPPSTQALKLVPQPRLRSSRLLAVLLVLQVLVILGSLWLESYEHETIVGSGPVFALVGLLIAIVARRRQDTAAAVFGGSAVALAALIVLLINVNQWLPSEGDRPITMMLYCYTAIALPMAMWLLLGRRRKRVQMGSLDQA